MLLPVLYCLFSLYLSDLGVCSLVEMGGAAGRGDMWILRKSRGCAARQTWSPAGTTIVRLWAPAPSQVTSELDSVLDHSIMVFLVIELNVRISVLRLYHVVSV